MCQDGCPKRNSGEASGTFGSGSLNAVVLQYLCKALL
jgi:hypothetical protein